MHSVSTVLHIFLIALAVRVIATPVSTVSASSSLSTLPPAPTCTLHVLREPSIGTDCTFKEHTRTATSYTDCGGCALETRVLGLGLPCRTITTVPGAMTTTVTACKPSGWKPTAKPTSSGY